MNEPRPEWYTQLKNEPFQGKPFNLEKIRQVEQRVAADFKKRKRRNKWKIAAFSLVMCLGVLLFAVLFNRGGADWLKAKVQTHVENTQPPEQVEELVTLTESQDKRIAILGDLKSANKGMLESITVRIDNKEQKFNWRSSTHPSFYPEVWLANIAGDDNPEVIINLTQGQETGMRESEVHVLNLDFSEIKVTNPLEELKSLVQTKVENRLGKHLYSITVSGQEHLFEDKETDESFRFSDVVLGNMIQYKVQDNALVAEVSAQAAAANILGTITMKYAVKDGALQAAHVEWMGNPEFTSLPNEKTTISPIRAAGKTKFGEMRIVSKSEETIETLGAPSCLGLAEDYLIKGDYQVLFKNAQGKEFVVSENELKSMISPTKNIIPMNELIFKEFDSLSFTPAYTDCHGIQFYLYGVTAKDAFPFKFQTEEGTKDSYYMGPATKLQVIEDQLIVEGGRAAGDAGYATRYFFKPNMATKTMVLVKTEKVIDKD